MSDTAILADHIDQQVDAILEVWRNTVEQFGNVPDAGRLSDREFNDHIPELLDHLSEKLRGGDSYPALVGQKHGQHRWSQGYDIAEVVSELGHLRSTLIRDTFKLAKSLRLDSGRVETMVVAIDEVFDEATAESVRQFQEDGQSLNRLMLDDFESRKQAAEAERIKLQTLLDHLPVGVWVASVDGTIVGVNREAERLQGFDGSETIGRINLTLDSSAYRIDRLDGAAYAAKDLPLMRALRGETVLQEEMLWWTDIGPRSMTANAAPLASPDGGVAGAVVVVQDISDRKRLEKELALSEARFRGIVDKSPVLIWRTDSAGLADFFNASWLEFRGRTADQEAGQGWLDGVHPDDRERCLDVVRAGIESRSAFELIHRLLHADGQYRWITARGAPYFDAQGAFLGVLGSSLDITARVELEAKLEEQSRHKTRLMSALSHDARTPLNAVVLSAKLLESQVKDQDDPEVLDCLTTIRNAVRNVLDLLSDLLDLTRIDAGATPAEVSRFDLRPTLSECLSGIEPQARAKGLDVRLDMGQLAEARVDTDRAKFKQILSNFLSNSLRYTEAGHIRLFADRVDGQLRIGVDDSGVGIAPRDRQRIFDEFAVLEHPNRPRGEGTGLGLAICRRLANLLDGEILLDSTPGRGSTFTLALPVSILARESDPREPVAVAPTASITAPILIAEDHDDSRRTLAKVLRRLGYRVQEAGDGRQVLELARQERPMVVLMDVNMPEMDGVEATLALRADPEFRDLPIFALTGDVSPLNQRRIGEAGVDGYLEKPVTWEKLEAALARLRPEPI